MVTVHWEGTYRDILFEYLEKYFRLNVIPSFHFVKGLMRVLQYHEANVNDIGHFQSNSKIEGKSCRHIRHQVVEYFFQKSRKINETKAVASDCGFFTSIT